MTCANCNATVESAFCPSCGQKSEMHRITIGHVVHEGIHSVTHADKGFLLLVRSLINRPGIVAKEFIEGKRKKYFNPISFLVISSALFYYFGTLTGYMDRLTNSGSTRAGGRPINETWQEAFRIASTSGKWLTLLLIAPLFALLSWLFFIRKKYNYAEHLVLHAFIFGQAALIRLLVFIPLFLMIPQYTWRINMFGYEILFLIFLVAAYHQFFEQHILLVIIKAVVIRFLFVVLFWALIYGYVTVKHLIIQ